MSKNSELTMPRYVSAFAADGDVRQVGSKTPFPITHLYPRNRPPRRRDPHANRAVAAAELGVAFLGENPAPQNWLCMTLIAAALSSVAWRS
jgi:hypothetical protein